MAGGFTSVCMILWGGTFASEVDCSVAGGCSFGSAASRGVVSFASGVTRLTNLGVSESTTAGILLRNTRRDALTAGILLRNTRRDAFCFCGEVRGVESI